MKNLNKNHQLSLLTLALLSSLSAHAAPPDAGQTMHELQKQPVLNPPKATAPVKLETEAVHSTVSNDALRMKVSAIRVAGSSVVSAAELESLLANLVGGEHSLAELEAGATRITAWYRLHGYSVARAYLPAQDIKDGVVQVQVLEGLIGQARVKNQSRLSDEVANAYLTGLKSGEVVQESTANRALLLLNDTPGVGGARASLQPGASVGTSDLIVELDPAAPYNANVELDNYGNRYTGEYRLGAALALNSPFKIGDQLTLRALVSDLNMTYARIAYQLPVGSDGLKVGGAYSDTRYVLGKDFAALRAHGTATSASLYVTYPFIRNPISSLYGTLTWENKTLLDLTDAPISSASKQVQLLNFGMMGKRQDGFGGGGITVVDGALIVGKLSMDAALLATDALSARSNGAFTRLTYNLNRLQRLTDKDSLSFVLSGQQAGKNLNSSEKFSLGGANGVRAYPQGEGVGDQGWMANMEVRHALLEQLQGVAFYDAGAVTINHTPFAATANTRNLAGAGVGLNAQYGWAQLKTTVAWRTSGGIPLAEPASLNRNPRIWMQLSGQF